MLPSSILSVHPRVCGEHSPERLSTPISCGSSPRLRGTQQNSTRGNHGERFIPASAGNTTAACTAALRLAVHPRVCGEHNSSSKSSILITGSSPRLRGTRFFARLSGLYCRFIPASAGNTSPLRSSSSTISVHPRVCGEHVKAPLSVLSATGSSPRLRGTHININDNADSHRFIPASAGNTGTVTRFTWVLTVHPRVCGEHIVGQPDFSMTFGSSPRLRGTRYVRIPPSLPKRFIPASAGNT